MKYLFAFIWFLLFRSFKFWKDWDYFMAQVSLRANYWSVKNPKNLHSKMVYGKRFYLTSKRRSL